MIITSGRRVLPLASASVAIIVGVLAAVHYYRLGLTLSHYDARGHLVVARRIIDSITPGWQQIGAVWLPLPHLLNAIPVQVDVFYRTGGSAVAVSILAFGLATGAIAWIVITLTGSAPAAIAGSTVFVLNPNVLYLQSTPMTEPLLLALTTLAVAMLMAWCDAASTGVVRSAGVGRRAGIPTGSGGETRVGVAFALACLTRYEAWPVTACALGAAVWAHWRGGMDLIGAMRRVAVVAAYPALAIAGFLIFSRVVIGEWFVASGFFVPENKALHNPLLAAAQVWWGVHTLSGYIVVVIAAIGAAGLVVIAAVSRKRSGVIALSLAATAVLPWAAFVEGHPFRIRYLVPVIAAEAVAAGVAAGLARRLRVPAALMVLGIAALELHPLNLHAPMVVEAQWDRPNVSLRQHVTQCLGPPQPGAKIMASMGSLGHYMQEASRAGFKIRDFLHEGNGDIWLAALDGPRPFADSILIEEKAEGGDMLAERAREDPQFLEGYSRVCEAAGLALYRRDPSQNMTFTVKR